MMKLEPNDLASLLTYGAYVALIVVYILALIAAATIIVAIILEIKWKLEEVKCNGGKRQKTEAYRIEDTGGQSGQAPVKRKRTQAAESENAEMPGMA